MKVHRRHRRGKSFYYLSVTKAYVFEKEAKQARRPSRKEIKEVLETKRPKQCNTKSYARRKGCLTGLEV